MHKCRLVNMNCLHAPTGCGARDRPARVPEEAALGWRTSCILALVQHDVHVLTTLIITLHCILIELRYSK